MKVYLDNASTTPMAPEVIEVMTDCMTNMYGNPSSTHAMGRATRNAIEQARKKIAYHLGVSTGEIFFTSGGTESNNMALKCAVRDLGVSHIISSPTEHHCVLHSLEALEANRHISVTYLDVDAQGRISYEQLENVLVNSSEKTMVSLMHANNEIGTAIDMYKVGALCKKYDAYFHSDTVQSMAHLPIDFEKANVHFLSGSGHKFHGPKGEGFIYVNHNCQIKPMIDGGSQERNMRAGTENLYGIVGMAKALEMAFEEMEERHRHIEQLRSYLKQLLQENFDDIRFNGEQEEGKYLYTVLSVSFPPNSKSELLILNMDIYGICVSGGSACSSGSDKGSHVMSAVGHDPNRKSIRFSFSHYNTKEEIEYTVKQLKQILPELVKV